MKEYSITDIRTMMREGRLNTTTLVRSYLENIACKDVHLNSIADLSMTALADARRLDQEYNENGPRSPLHGVPVLIKDNIFTADGLRTSANAQVLKAYRAPYDATVVKRLRDAGCVILGKANCSEFAYFMSKYPHMPSGFGSLHGQVVHPYNPRLDPLGSSTGSAVAVAANLATVSIGTETNGSLMSPAWANSIVSIKPTLGSVSRHGIIPVSSMQDMAGPMSRTVEDSALVLDAIKGLDDADPSTVHADHETESYADACHVSPKGLKVAVVTFENRSHSDEEKRALREAAMVLEQGGVTCETATLKDELGSNYTTLIHEFKRDFNTFLGDRKNRFPVETLLDIIRFNRRKPSLRMPYGQCTFHAAQATSGTLKEPAYLQARSALDSCIERFLDWMEKASYDAMVTTSWSSHAPIGGLPSIIVPAKALREGLPVSVMFIGNKWTEKKLFRLAAHYERKTGHRIPPIIGEC